MEQDQEMDLREELNLIRMDPSRRQFLDKYFAFILGPKPFSDLGRRRPFIYLFICHRLPGIETHSQLAQKLGVSRSMASKLVAKMKCELAQVVKTGHVDPESLIALHVLRTLTHAELGKLVGLSRSRVTQLCNQRRKELGLNTNENHGIHTKTNPNRYGARLAQNAGGQTPLTLPERIRRFPMSIGGLPES